jgi:5'/3'-nucleotidase SurE
VAQFKILITNDDGIRSILLTHFVGWVLEEGLDVWVVVSEKERRGIGHSVCMYDELSAIPYDDGLPCPAWTMWNGSPMDYVNVVLGFLIKEVDLVFSGFNWGCNITMPLLLSFRTVAGAMEGYAWGISSIALSHELSGFGYISDGSQFPNDEHFIKSFCASEEYAIYLIWEILKNNFGVGFHNVNFLVKASKDTPIARTFTANTMLEQKSSFSVYTSLYRQVAGKNVYRWKMNFCKDNGSSLPEESDAYALAQGHISHSIVDWDRVCH